MMGQYLWDFLFYAQNLKGKEREGKEREGKEICGFSHFKRLHKTDREIKSFLGTLQWPLSSVKNVRPLRLLAFMLQTQRSRHENEETSELAQNYLTQLPATFQPWRPSHAAEAGWPWRAAEPEVPLLAVRENHVFSAHCWCEGTSITVAKH